MGRSLVPAGGSDMIEAAALGKPTAFGPHTFNFPQAADLEKNGCARVADAATLAAQLDSWLSQPQQATQAGKQAQEFIRRQQGNPAQRGDDLPCDRQGSGGRTGTDRDGQNTGGQLMNNGSFPKLFVTDLDGTALGGDYQPYARFPDPFSAFLDRLAAHGCQWAISTTWDAAGQYQTRAVQRCQKPSGVFHRGGGLPAGTVGGRQAGVRPAVHR